MCINFSLESTKLKRPTLKTARVTLHCPLHEKCWIQPVSKGIANGRLHQCGNPRVCDVSTVARPNKHTAAQKTHQKVPKRSNHTNTRKEQFERYQHKIYQPNRPDCLDGVCMCTATNRVEHNICVCTILIPAHLSPMPPKHSKFLPFHHKVE